MSILSGLDVVDDFAGELVRGVGVFTIYAGMLSGMYITINAIREMNYKNITLYALMTGGLFYGLTKLNEHRRYQPVGPLTEVGLISATSYEDQFYDKGAEWV